jgi:AraC family transcriptional regulator, regulatory protein of adaptative response / methylated-DNA-[protein]-cysteine methyltransferase
MPKHTTQQAKDAQLWRAVVRKDGRFDGRFVFGVRTTGIYCRPSCPARRPLRRNVAFFAAPELARQAGLRACKRCHPDRVGVLDPATERVLAICHYIRSAPAETLTLARLGRRFSLSPAHLQREFRRRVGISPLEYVEACRMDQLKRALREGASVSDAIYDAGFGSPSRVYERSNRALGMTPRRYAQGAKDESIEYTVVPCALGNVLIAVTDKGICAVKLGDDREVLERELSEEFPAASLTRDDALRPEWVRSVVALAEGQPTQADLPLDIRGTAFQQMVWKALRRIPAGQTRSYGEIARSIGRPQAVRAVAGACGANPTALLVPCHRVIQGNGALGGYHWGVPRKRRLLAAEGAQVRGHARMD